MRDLWLLMAVEAWVFLACPLMLAGVFTDTQGAVRRLKRKDWLMLVAVCIFDCLLIVTFDCVSRAIYLMKWWILLLGGMWWGLFVDLVKSQWQWVEEMAN